MPARVMWAWIEETFTIAPAPSARMCGSGDGLVGAAEKGIGGGIGASQDGGPGQVTFYVEVDDPAAYLARAETLGGKTIVPPSEVPDFGLTFAFFADPEGHVVGLSKGAVR